MVIIPPRICSNAGISPNRTRAIAEATTGSHNFDADTKAGEKYFKHQVKILCPRSVEKIPSRSPQTAGLMPYSQKRIF